MASGCQGEVGTLRSSGSSWFLTLLWSHWSCQGNSSCLRILGVLLVGTSHFWLLEDPQKEGLMPPACPASSSSQCHPAVSGDAGSSGGGHWWSASGWPLRSLFVSASLCSVNSHFLRVKNYKGIKEFLKELYTLKTGVCENNLQDGVVWHMRFGKIAKLRWHRP